MSKHKHQESHNEFQELVASIRSAEDESDRMRADYDARIAELLGKGREKSVEMRESYEKRAAEAKNRILAGEREKTEKMAEKIIADAKKQANRVRGRKLDRKGLQAVFDGFVSSL